MHTCVRQSVHVCGGGGSSQDKSTDPNTPHSGRPRGTTQSQEEVVRAGTTSRTSVQLALG